MSRFKCGCNCGCPECEKTVGRWIHSRDLNENLRAEVETQAKRIAELEEELAAANRDAWNEAALATRRE